MNPELEKRLADMQQQIDELNRFYRSWFSSGEVDPQIKKTVTKIVGGISINDLSDVDTTGVVNGEVLKYNNGTWEPAADIDT